MSNKGILIMGSPASGKTQFEEELCRWDDFQEPEIWGRLDPDIWVENEDSEFYNNPLKASNYLYKTILPNQMDEGWNFILQTVGSNTNTLRKIIDYKQYQWKVIIVYCNPIIAFKRNFSRDRRIPKQVLLDRWLQVYSQIDEYINMFGRDNIYVYETEYTPYEELILDGQLSVKDELKCLDVESSFRADTTHYTVEQIIEKQSKFIKLLEEIDSKIQFIENKIDTSCLFYRKKQILQEISEWKN